MRPAPAAALCVLAALLAVRPSDDAWAQRASRMRPDNAPAAGSGAPAGFAFRSPGGSAGFGAPAPFSARPGAAVGSGAPSAFSTRPDNAPTAGSRKPKPFASRPENSGPGDPFTRGIGTDRFPVSKLETRPSGGRWNGKSASTSPAPTAGTRVLSGVGDSSRSDMPAGRAKSGPRVLEAGPGAERGPDPTVSRTGFQYSSRVGGGSAFLPGLSFATTPAGRSAPVPTDLGRREQGSAAVGTGPSEGRGGFLEIAVPQKGAAVYLDGRRLGVTPLGRVPLPEGEYRIKIAKYGFRSREAAVRVAADKAVRIEGALQPLR